MKGDFTRSTFQPNKHYTSVRMQQGRLQLDSDWNEQVDIEAYLRHAQAVDMIGADSGVPTSEGDSAEPYRDSFKISVTPDGSDLAIAPGSLYVCGTLCELETGTHFTAKIKASNRVEVSSLIVDGHPLEQGQWLEYPTQGKEKQPQWLQIQTVTPNQRELTFSNVNLKDVIGAKTEDDVVGKEIELRRLLTYNTQPDYPNTNDEPALEEGVYLAYIDVWQRHITALEDSTIREVALNIPDTTTRTKTVWQLKLKKLDNLKKITESDTQKKEWEDFFKKRKIESRQPYLNACAKYCSASGSSASAETGYRRLDNQLYRVEIHDPSPKATFKWSRDNGSIVSTIKNIQGNTIIIRKTSQDAWTSSQTGQWIEITNEEMELKGKPGALAPLLRASDTKIEFDTSRITNGEILPKATKVRRWEQIKEVATANQFDQSGWIDLEAGIQVQFNKDSVYETGDYWLIPARSATNDIEWPNDQAKPTPKPLRQLPQGIEHDYCALALLKVNSQGKFEQDKPDQDESESKNIQDLRVIFPPLMRCLDTAGGVISGTLEVQSGLYVTRKYDNNEKRYITGKLGVGTKKPLARLHVESPTAIPAEAEEKISSKSNTVTGNGDTFESLGIDDAIIIRDSLGKIQTRIVTRPPSDFEGKSLEIDAPFDSDLEDVNFEYQPASDRTLDIVRLVDRDRTIQLLVNAEGKVGIGTSTPCNQLDVLGGVAIGQAYAGETKAPDNGLLVDGTVCIGSTLPSDATNFKLYVNGNIKGNSITAKSGIFRSQEGANLSFQTGDITRISVFNSTGNVSIGSVNDEGVKLFVDGEIQGESLSVQSGVVRSLNNQNLSLQTSETPQLTIFQSTGNVSIGSANDAGVKLFVGGTIQGERLRVQSGAVTSLNNQNLSLQTNETPQLTIFQSTGNVSIGSSDDAGVKLFVGGTIQGERLRVQSGAVTSLNNQNLSLQTNETPQLTIFQSTGNVSIGSANDAGVKLFVGGTIQGERLRVQSGAVTSLNNQNLSLQTNGNPQLTIFQSTGNVSIGSANDAGVKLFVGGTIQGEHLSVQSGVVGSLNVINGNVGIGLTNPAQQLLVVENGQVGIGYNQSTQSAMLAVKGNVGIGTPNPEAQLHVVGAVQVEADQNAIALGLSQSNKSVNIGFQGSRLNFTAKDIEGYSFDRPIAVSLAQNNETAFGSALKLERNTQSVNLGFQNQNFVLRTNNQDAIAIAPDGNISIGNTNTRKKTLHVNGNVEVETEQGVLTLGLMQNTGSDFLSTLKLTSQSQSVNLGFHNQNFVLRTNDQDAIAIAPDGEITIGNTATKNAQLQLNGTFQVEAAQNAIAVSLSPNNETDFGSALQLSRNTQSVHVGFQNQNFVLRASNQDRIAIDYETGNVGIGLDPDADAKLNLGGALKLTTSEKFVSIAPHFAQCEFNTNSSQYYFDKPIAVDGEIISNRLELKADDKSSATISYKNGSVMIDGSTPSANDQSNVNLYVNGKLYAKSVATETINSKTIASVKSVSNGFYQVSSRTLKEDINDLSSQEVAALLRSLNPVKFIYTEDESKTPHAGFIAEDTPDLLTVNDKQAIKVVDIVAVLTKVVQDHRKTLTDLVKVVRKQQSEIATLTQKLQELEEKKEP